MVKETSLVQYSGTPTTQWCVWGTGTLYLARDSFSVECLDGDAVSVSPPFAWATSCMDDDYDDDDQSSIRTNTQTELVRTSNTRSYPIDECKQIWDEFWQAKKCIERTLTQIETGT